ncbi:hypothetical protein LB559_14225 [Mesorhizobium sp. BR1-1-3]|uniref:hypothetical protein n=2 Tax=Mesorhizobium TaxID=68287 RepID=UPI0013E0AF60|nr:MULTISPECIES: hypothetical protein [unclassified Mesorhizobium]MBZ9889096.1 hypothetical protein [Mesorhizobium sp. BR1-1-3]
MKGFLPRACAAKRDLNCPAADCERGTIGSEDLWNGVRSDDAAFIFQDANSSDFRAVEFQANADTAAVFRDENGAGVFKRGLQRVADILVGKVDPALEFLDDQRIHT